MPEDTFLQASISSEAAVHVSDRYRQAVHDPTSVINLSMCISLSAEPYQGLDLSGMSGIPHMQHQSCKHIICPCRCGSDVSCTWKVCFLCRHGDF